MAHTKFIPDPSDFLTAAIKYNGSILKLARHYNVHKDTMFEYLKRDPVGRKTIDKVRGLNQETHLDLAEQVFMYNMANLEKSPGLAQRAAEKVMDKLGYKRGWLPDSTGIESDDDRKALEAKFEEIMNQLMGSASQRKIEESSINNDTKS